MPTVHVNMFRGRTMDQKRALVRSVTDAVVASLGVRPEGVRVLINETDPENSAIGGVLRTDAQER